MIPEFVASEPGRALCAQLGVSDAQLVKALSIASTPAPAEKGVTGVLAQMLAPSVQSRIAEAVGVSEAVAGEIERRAVPALKLWSERAPAYPAPASPCGVDGLL